MEKKGRKPIIGELIKVLLIVGGVILAIWMIGGYLDYIDRNNRERVLDSIDERYTIYEVMEQYDSTDIYDYCLKYIHDGDYDYAVLDQMDRTVLNEYIRDNDVLYDYTSKLDAKDSYRYFDTSFSRWFKGTVVLRYMEDNPDAVYSFLSRNQDIVYDVYEQIMEDPDAFADKYN